MSTFQNFIAGSFRETGPRPTIEVKNPATGRVFASVTSATEADVIEAVDAATAAQKPIAAQPPIPPAAGTAVQSASAIEGGPASGASPSACR